jgi:hypothetical protein
VKGGVQGHEALSVSRGLSDRHLPKNPIEARGLGVGAELAEAHDSARLNHTAQLPSHLAFVIADHRSDEPAARPSLNNALALELAERLTDPVSAYPHLLRETNFAEARPWRQGVG